MAGKRIGVLALQGAFIEHEQAIKRCQAEAVQVRTVAQVREIDGLIIPGGESTTIGKLMTKFGLDKAIQAQFQAGMPIWGTCAGMIMIAREIVGSDQFSLGFMDISVVRNGFGRQVNSFETDLDIAGLGATKGVFIRAPYVQRVWGEARVMATYEDKIVMVQQGNNLLATAFHPELSGQLDIHKYFLSMI